MKSSGTSEFWQLYRELPEPIRQIARRTYRLWKENPRAAMLRFKKVRDVYSVNNQPPVTLRAFYNGCEAPPCTFNEPGEHDYSLTLLPFSTGDGDIRVDFLLDHALPPDHFDPRERGIVVTTIHAEPASAEVKFSI